MIVELIRPAGLLVTAWLFGGMFLFAAGFAAFLFKVMPVAEARTLIRKAFPPFYLFVIGTALLAGLMLATRDPRPATRDQRPAGCRAARADRCDNDSHPRVLMPAINRATDRGDRRRFAMLHGLSVLIPLAHIAIADTVLVRLAA